LVDADHVLGKLGIAILDVGQPVGLGLGGDDGSRRHVLAWGDLHILDQAMQHDDAAIPNPSVEHRRAEANKAVVAHVGRPVDQSHVGNGSVSANPNGVGLAVFSYHPPLFQAVDDHPILNVGSGANVEGGSLVSANGSSRGDQHLRFHPHIPNEVGERMHVGCGINLGLRQSARPGRWRCSIGVSRHNREPLERSRADKGSKRDEKGRDPS